MIYVFGAYEFDTDRRVLCLAGGRWTSNQKCSIC